jgi:glycosyltransferase involved in cell wall biosynthesis
MIVTTYLHTAHIPRPTGVGKHVINMPLEMSRIPGADVRLLAPKREYSQCRKTGCEWPFGDMPLTLLPGRRRAWEFAWRAAGVPKIDRWVAGADWVYSPSEVFIPSRRVPVAVTIHCVHWFEKDYPAYDSPEYRQARFRWSTILRPVFRHSRLILVVSEYLKTKVHEIFGVPMSRMAVVGNGVEQVFYERAASQTQQPLPVAGAPYVLVIGGLTMRKGAEYVLGVARALAAAGSDIQVAVAGPSHDGYLSLAREFPNITHLGYVGLDRMPAVLRGARALLCLSRHETFGIPVAEAMAVGTPVIASRFAALPETVGDAGILVDAAAAAEIARTLIDVDRSEPARAELIAKGRARAATMTWAACAERLHTALQDALADPSHQASGARAAF